MVYAQKQYTKIDDLTVGFPVPRVFPLKTLSKIMSKLQTIKIILVEPAGPLNVGSVARIMKNMGLQQLILVNPQCDRLGEDARKMAVHGIDVLENAQEVATLPEALAGCQRAIATRGRSRSLPTVLETPRQGLPWLLSESLTTALIFGPEDRGLSNDELQYAQRYVGIPANPDYPSLNLAQAVAVCAYELYQIAVDPLSSALDEREQISPPAPIEQLEAYYQQLENLLLDIGYLYPHTAPSRMKKFRQMYNRAQLTPEEVAMLRGILSQIDWHRQHLSVSPSQGNLQANG
jgi:tRNA/rRNA methyltransferase